MEIYTAFTHQRNTIVNIARWPYCCAMLSDLITIKTSDKTIKIFLPKLSLMLTIKLRYTFLGFYITAHGPSLKFEIINKKQYGTLIINF